MVTDPKFYAILIHGADPDEKKQPGFAQVMFPSENYTHPYHRIDLFDMHKELVKSLLITPSREEEAENLFPIQMKDNLLRR